MSTKKRAASSSFSYDEESSGDDKHDYEDDQQKTRRRSKTNQFKSNNNDQKQSSKSTTRKTTNATSKSKKAAQAKLQLQRAVPSPVKTSRAPNPREVIEILSDDDDDDYEDIIPAPKRLSTSPQHSASSSSSAKPQHQSKKRRTANKAEQPASTTTTIGVVTDADMIKSELNNFSDLLMEDIAFDDNEFGSFVAQHSSAASTTTTNSDSSTKTTRVPKQQRQLSKQQNQRSESEMWVEKYQPHTEEELSISKKKIAEVKSWFQNAFDPRSIIDTLFLIGPNGCGKTALLSVLAREFDCDLLYWNNDDVTSTWSSDKTDNFSRGGDSDNEEVPVIPYKSRMDAFEKFLDEGRRYSGLVLASSSDTVSSGRSILVVEDLPNVSGSAQLMRRDEILTRFCSTAINTGSTVVSNNRNIYSRAAQAAPTIQRKTNKPKRKPLVFVMAFHDGPFTNALSRFIPHQVLTSPNVQTITMGPITVAATKKALQNVLKYERSAANFSRSKKQPRQHLNLDVPEDVLKTIAEEANGDLRNAIAQLQLYCTQQKRSRRSLNTSKTTVKPSTESKRLSRSASAFNKKFNKDRTDFDADDEHTEDEREPKIARDTYIDLHRAAGRILYGKRKENGELENVPEDVPRAVHCNESLLISYVHHNMLSFASDVDDIANCLEHISLGDTYFSKFVEGKNMLPMYGFSISARGYLLHNKSHTANTWRQLRAPLIGKINDRKKANKKTIQELFSLTSVADPETGRLIFSSGGALFEEAVPYAKIMKNNVPLTHAQRSFLDSVHNYPLRGSNQGRFNNNNNRSFMPAGGADDREAYEDEEESSQASELTNAIQRLRAPTSTDDDSDGDNDDCLKADQQQQQQQQRTLPATTSAAAKGVVMLEEDIEEFSDFDM